MARQRLLWAIVLKIFLPRSADSSRQDAFVQGLTVFGDVGVVQVGGEAGVSRYDRNPVLTKLCWQRLNGSMFLRDGTDIPIEDRNLRFFTIEYHLAEVS